MSHCLFTPVPKTEARLRYGATRAHNRHMADFCGDDDRLLGVAIAPLDVPRMAIEELDFIIEAGP